MTLPIAQETLLSDSDLKNTLLLDILHDTNVSDRHIEALAALIQSQKMAWADYVVGTDAEFAAADDLHRDAYTVQPRVKSIQRQRNNLNANSGGDDE